MVHLGLYKVLKNIEEGKTKSGGFRKIVAEFEVHSPRRGDRRGGWCQRTARQRLGGQKECGERTHAVPAFTTLLPSSDHTVV